jgi:hypothetical protein
VRRSQPAGFIEATSLELAELAWEAEAEDLSGSLTVPLTAWGRGAGEPPARTVPDEPQRPSAAPEVDLSGRWNLRVFAPQGLTNATAEFKMTDDGSLTGEVRGTRLGGVLEGWVSGRDFRFSVATDRQSIRLTYTGSASAAGDSIRGTVAFGETADFSFGFRGGRAEADAGPEEGEDPEDEVPDEPGEPGGRRPGGGPPGGAPAGGLPAPRGDAPGALARQLLLPPPEIRSPAPGQAEVRIEAGGERRDRTVSGLEAARAVDLAFAVAFEDLRKASLSSSQVKLRVRWGDERRELARELSPELLLTRLHEPIVLRGWSEVKGVLDDDEDARRIRVGTWRIPDALSGFTLELRTAGAPGQYRLGGQAMDGERVILCAPCREGDRLELEVRAPEEWEGTPTVVVVEPGYPAAAKDPSAPAAREWLDALRGGGNRRYLELNARFSETGS